MMKLCLSLCSTGMSTFSSPSLRYAKQGLEAGPAGFVYLWIIDGA